ncbi:MAG: cation:proton antiporter [Bacteriovoracaceae bacterium]|nr:cation:proton antiporter [Bacteriovoracaceae bacterium]
MNHLPPMILDLTVILVAAALSTIIFSRFKQPIVLGYLIAGFAVGPHFSLWPTVVDTEGVKIWAEIGVIFLLFGLGLEFSFKKLAKVGKSASISAGFEVITMLGLGYLVGRAFGWSTMDSLFLGAILSMSSTTIIIRAFDEAGLKGKGFVSLVFGILIVEDLIAILLMVFLTAISVPGNFSGSNLIYLSARLGFFLMIWFLVGIYILPSALKKVRKFLSNEIMLVVSIGLCFLMVVLASKAGFSAALGAFIMGSILAETQEGERIEHLLLPVKDLFAAVFFVSVGMMINPAILQEHYGIVLLIVGVTIIGKLLGSGFGAILSGRSLKQSVQAGMSLAQIGEFSFIIATLGMSLKVTSDFLYPIVIAVSAVTTFTTPYMIKFSDPIYNWIEARIPDRFLENFRKYELAMNADSKEGAFGLLWRIYGLAALLNSVVVIAIALAAGRYLMPLMIVAFGKGTFANIVTSIITILLCSPFLVAIVIKTPKKLSTEEVQTLARLRRLQIGVLIMRILIGFGLTAFIVKQFSSTRFLFAFVMIAASALIFALRKFIKPFYSSVEKHFLSNLNGKELAEIETIAKLPELAPWNATLVNLTLSSDSILAGLTLEESRFRTVSGATVAMIDRGKRRIFAPTRAERLLPNDQLFLIGTDEQLTTAQILIEAKNSEIPPPHDELFSLESILIEETSMHAHKSIREIGSGEGLGGLIVGIERKSQRILNPESNVVIEPDDLIWVFGRRDRIRALKQTSH